MRFLTALTALAVAATSAHAGWLPAISSPATGAVYKNGDAMTITWDASSYNSTANEYGKFFLGYQAADAADDYTTVAQFVGTDASYGSEYPLWEGESSLTFTISISDGLSEYMGQQIWSLTEFGGDEDVQTGLFTIEA
ncbi:hypothetical protein JCM8547_001142 [Rhodosporidiobolus lusitaniae]